MTPGTLKDGEPHPAASAALAWLSDQSPVKLLTWRESLASCAIEGNRMAEICGETLERVLTGKPISDRYLLGLAWYMRHETDFYEKIMEATRLLIDTDPEPVTPEAKLLVDLTIAMEKYEKVKYPFPEPSAEELEKFRKEEAGD